MTVLKPFSLNARYSTYYVLNIFIYSVLSMTTVATLYFIGRVVDGSVNLDPEFKTLYRYIFLVVVLLYGFQIYTLKNSLKTLALIIAENFSVRFKYATEGMLFPKQYEQLFGVESQRIQQNFGNSLNQFVLSLVGLVINVTAILLTNLSLGLFVAFTFMLVVAFFNFVLRAKQVRLGEEISIKMKSIVNDTNLIASHNKEIFCNELGFVFSRSYADSVKDAFQAMSFSSLIAGFPKIIVEFLLVIGLSAVVLSTVIQKDEAESIQSQLGNLLFLGFVGARLVPNLQGIYASTMFINSVKSSLIKLLSIPTERPMPQSYHVSLEDVKKISVSVKLNLPDYVSNLQHQEFSLCKGKVLAITGDSGCGKTTFVESILGVNNLKIADLYDDYGKSIKHVPGSYLPQRSLFAAPEILPLLIKNIAHDTKIFGLFKASLKEIYPEFNYDAADQDKLTSLSAGQIQRVALCYVLAVAKDLIVLDEPTGALDKHSEIMTLKMLASFAARHNKFIIIISHAHNLPETISEVKLSK